MAINKRFIVITLACVSTLTLFAWLTTNVKSLASGGVNSKINHQNSDKTIKTDNESSAPEMSELSISTISDFGQFDGVKIDTAPSDRLLAGTDTGDEREPNDTPATANALTGSESKMRGNILPETDLDYFSFTANAGDRVYAAVMTAYSSSFNVSSNTDSQLRIFAADGTTVLETDDDDGGFTSMSSTIAGVTIPSNGIYYAQVSHPAAINFLRPYDFYLKVQRGAPTAEIEPNDTPAAANAFPANGFVSGARNSATAVEQDWFSLTLNAGDTVFLSLDLDPERDNVQWDGRLSLASFGDARNQMLSVNDTSAGTVANPLSEAFFFTVRETGTYYAVVDSANAAVGGATATYNLSASIIPRRAGGTNCTVYNSANVPQTIGPAAGLVSSTLTIPGNPRIASLRVLLDVNHTFISDLDFHLRSPAGNDNGLLTDIGSTALGGESLMNLTLDDRAGLPPLFNALRPIIIKPELEYRLDWFDGENAGGTWTLDIRDDLTNASGGTLTGWGLEICEALPNNSPIIYSENFETGNGGYTHSGVSDEWEYGAPNTAATSVTNAVAAFTNCHSGANCWKTDLDNTYDVNSAQDLFSPPVSLVGRTGQIRLEWAMRYQMENANFDQLSVEVQDLNNAADNRIVWQWTGETMRNGVGTPTVSIGESAGWGVYTADISDFAGKNIRLRFHLDSDDSFNFGGAAIDDVMIRAAQPTAAGVSIAGRIKNAKGAGIRNARVVLTDSAGENRIAFSGSFGAYRFDDIRAGETYVITANSRQYRFNPRLISVTEDVADADLTAIQWK